MINKFARTLSSSPYSSARTLFSTQTPAQPKLQKVSDAQVTFKIRNINGQWEKVPAFVGEPFLASLMRSKVQAYEQINLCGGGDVTYPPWERPVDPFSAGPSCGSCRIILRDNWYGRIEEQTGGYVTGQEVLLTSQNDHREDVRLACCLPVEAWMNGCTFEVLGETELSELTQIE